MTGSVLDCEIISTSDRLHGWRLAFRQAGDFEAARAAERFLAETGFSVGIMQAHSPRGILFGDFTIAKWRNLTEADRETLHGTMTGDRRGPVCVWIKSTAPSEAHEALCAAALGLPERPHPRDGGLQDEGGVR